MIVEPGDIWAGMGRGLPAWLIGEFTGPVSHLGIFTECLCDSPPCLDPEHWLVTQALGAGIETLTLAETMATARYGYVLHCTDISAADRAEMVRYALTFVGTAYADANLFWEGVSAITGDEKWAILMADDGRDICSEFVSVDYIHIGMSCEISPRKATPTDWFNFSLAQPNWLTQPLLFSTARQMASPIS